MFIEVKEEHSNFTSKIQPSFHSALFFEQLESITKYSASGYITLYTADVACTMSNICSLYPLQI